MPPRRHITAAEANHAAKLESVKNILWGEDSERGLYAVGRQCHLDDEELIGGPDKPSHSDHITDTTNDKKRKGIHDEEHQKPEHEKKQKSEHEREEESKLEKKEDSEPKKEQKEQTDDIKCESEVKDE
jgi:hypothetical protein